MADTLDTSCDATTLLLLLTISPFAKVGGDCSQDNISNVRLSILKEKAFRYKFKMLCVPGVKHHAADSIYHFTQMVMQKSLCVLTILDQSLGKHRKVTACAYTHSCTPIMILKIVIMFQTTVGNQHCILQPHTHNHQLAMLL